MLKKMGHFVKYILIFIGVLLLALVLTMTWALKNPQGVWSLTKKYVLPDDMQVTTSDVQLQLKYLSGLNFYVNVEISNLHIVKSEPMINFPIDHIKLSASVFPQSDEQKVIVHQIHLQAEKVLRFKPRVEATSTLEQNPFQTFQQSISYIEFFQKHVQLQNVDVTVEDFRIHKNLNNFTKMTFRLGQNEGDEKPDQLDFSLQTEIPGQQPMLIGADGSILLPTKKDANLWLKSQVIFSGLGIESTENIEMNYAGQKTKLTIQGPIVLRKKDVILKSDLKAELNMDSAGADLDLSAKISGIPGSLVKVDSLKAQMHSPFEKDQTLSPAFSTFNIDVPVKIFFIDKDMAKPLAESCQCKIPEVIGAKLSGKIWLSRLLANRSEKAEVLQAYLKLEDVDNKLITMNAAGGIKIEKQNEKYSLLPEIDTTGTINSFQGLRRFLDAKGIMIPAPLSVLDGKIHFSMNGPVNSTSEKFLFPSETTIKLTSNRQIVDLKAHAKVALNQNFKAADVDVEVLINQLQLELPPLDPIQGKPRIAPDQRILRTKFVKKPSQFNLKVTVQARTTQPGAVKLISKYFDPYLPITFDVFQAADRKNSGHLQLEPFNVNYLRRTVHVEKMRVQLPRNQSQFFEVDGRLRIKQTEYTLFIDIQGPSNAPNITLSSIPYLPRSEIISVLIYDRTSDELVSSDAKTAGNVEAAIVDRAVGLFGIWAFASTPIKGFSYNPVTKVYTATVAVSDDVIASVGTNWEEATQVELRKKVARQWMLTAAWTPAGRDQDEVTSLVLQWENRF